MLDVSVRYILIHVIIRDQFESFSKPFSVFQADLPSLLGGLFVLGGLSQIDARSQFCYIL